MRVRVEELITARALRGDWRAALFLLELRYGRSEP